ncbi:FadR/GntR family transcriptional regulator [Roseiterribacter gracilis]|uniref:GntR family transcriptional regulator n=1 Tax=Roseiterribacter gracilis TaxID=2812848 RepID=A0A8S8XBT5_9PROT|nr:GntR family transcriptional regulator [Rhodospirillales bacterium TMPK1]
MTSSGKKLYQGVVEAIVQSIRDGIYTHGQRLPSERDLAEEFGVSRPTVREAMIALEIRGIVEARHGSGIYITNGAIDVAAPDLDIGAFELTEARRLFEGETAALAAATINDQELAELEAILLDMEAENYLHVPGEVADRRFHVAIASATHNSAIVTIVEMLWDARDKSPLCNNMMERSRKRGVVPAMEEHRRIYEALKARDPRAAGNAMREHLTRVITNLLTVTELETMEKTRTELEAKRAEVARRISI